MLIRHRDKNGRPHCELPFTGGCLLRHIPQPKPLLLQFSDGIFLRGLTVIDPAGFVERFSSNQFSLPLPERTCPELLIPYYVNSITGFTKPVNHYSVSHSSSLSIKHSIASAILLSSAL